MKNKFKFLEPLTKQEKTKDNDDHPKPPSLEPPTKTTDVPIALSCPNIMCKSKDVRMELCSGSGHGVHNKLVCNKCNYEDECDHYMPLPLQP
jgi:hypothetical protein